MKRSVADDLSRCFTVVKDAEANGISSSTVFTATRFVNAQSAGEESVKNKYVDERIALTERMVPGWRKAAQTDVGQAGFRDRLRKMLENDFGKKCGESIQVPTHLGAGSGLLRSPTDRGQLARVPRPLPGEVPPLNRVR